MHTSIEEQVRTFVVENFLFGQDGSLRNDESFLESGIIDSTGVLELVSFLQERFTICIEDDELVPANLDSVERVTRFVLRKVNTAEARLAG